MRRIATGAGACAAAMLALLAGCSEPDVILPGKRLDLRADLNDPDAPSAAEAARRSNRAAPISLGVARARADWPQTGGGATHDAGHAALSAAPRPVFSVSVGQGDDRRHRITATPVVDGGRVFTVDSRAGVVAHSTGGRALWARDLTPPGDAPDDASGAGLAAGGGRLYVSTGFGELVALDAATGREYWRQDLDASTGGAPTLAGGLVYVTGRDDRAWAIEADTGRVRWTLPGVPSSAGMDGGSTPAVDGRVAVFPYASGDLTAVLRDGGVQLWGATVAGRRRGVAAASIVDVSGAPVISGGRVYAGTSAGRTAALDLSSGETLWVATEGAMAPPVVIGGSVFVMSDRNELLRLDAATGDRVWGAELPLYTRADARKRTGTFAHYGPVLAGGRLWVASDDGALRGFDPVSGALGATLPLPGGAATAPVVAGGTLYVVSGDGMLHAYR